MTLGHVYPHVELEQYEKTGEMSQFLHGFVDAEVCWNLSSIPLNLLFPHVEARLKQKILYFLLQIESEMYY
jgi:hypothetical protein